MKVLFIGDIVGSVGRKALKEKLPELVRKHHPAIVIANGENAASGRGITKQIVKEMHDMGIHGITLGNHAWDQKETASFIDDEQRLIRPANFPPDTPGRGMMTIRANGKELTIINLQGRTFLPPLDCPFRKADELLDSLGSKPRCVLVDFHAEATSEKIAMGWHLDGRVSAVVGTHTHVQSHDERVLPGGTAYVTDVGMVGPRDGVLGMEREAVLYKFKTQLPVRFVVDEGKWHFHAVIIDMDEQTGRSGGIELIRLEEDRFYMN
ncbi:TIGR00282 family metallophosphoesterase [Paenibacillus cymbidii]|uniref:TIGR00282 family metallophosphoesterase n=1 Tax=Paenibacillus cymbidii TaxID=1639034 RepID=UPI001080E0C4|nr:TIGR00282 family metallophosphoesterase [Paenibacillus cymbidii]